MFESFVWQCRPFNNRSFHGASKRTYQPSFVSKAPNQHFPVLDLVRQKTCITTVDYWCEFTNQFQASGVLARNSSVPQANFADNISHTGGTSIGHALGRRRRIALGRQALPRTCRLTGELRRLGLAFAIVKVHCAAVPP